MHPSQSDLPFPDPAVFLFVCVCVLTTGSLGTSLYFGVSFVKVKVGPRRLGHFTHDAFWLHVILSPCIDGHMGTLQERDWSERQSTQLDFRELTFWSISLFKAGKTHP